MSYATLVVGVGWLKNFGALVDDAQDGLTEYDVEKAEAFADRRVNIWALKHGYNVSAAAFITAPVIIEAAEMFGSARMIEFKFARDDDANVAMSASLLSDAQALLDAVRHTGLYAADGARIWPEDVAAVIRVSNPSDT